ncbi:fibronectin type 3 domain-containing protein [Chitinophaga rupis]|uniref:Fibronectin type 3 domain-containing protein n=1 Tax=Chitinophaga rupis TaxID=573321 RepID=A0A1H7S7K5_9BACT|nr:fibronectin type 3 domain-containing protein [Chitinophaga rupis]
MSDKRIIRSGIYALLLTGSLFFTGRAVAQKSNAVTKPAQVAVIARPFRDSVLLRWAPVNEALWSRANVNGYMIKRYTLLRNGALLPVPEEALLTSQPLHPLPLKAWEQVVKENEKYGAVAAQAIYGDNFQVDMPDKKSAAGIIEIYHKSQELQTRYSFALFSADQSFTVARAAALAFVDKTADPREKYLYQVYIAAGAAGPASDTGFVFTGYADHQPLPAPRDLQAVNAQKAVLLSWNKNLLEHVFTAYQVERSDDEGKTFHSLEQEPVVNADNEAKATGAQQRFFRIDTVQELDHRYVYRIKGISPFGEISPPSDTAQVYVTAMLAARPSITDAVVLNNSQVSLQWYMPPGKARVRAFELERAVAANKPYKKINQKELKPIDSFFVDESPLASNYYRVKVITNDGQVSWSLPRFVQLEDSTPPAAPAGLTGKISDKGVVQLSWPANKERDLYAYRVFRANVPDAEFVQVTKEPLLRNSFTDTITINTLTKYVYYKVVALDGHYNPSEFSLPLQLKRPDIIPPVPPSFTDLQAGENGIFLQWQRSTSEDVVQHELLRSKDTAWQLMHVFASADTTGAYTDTSALPGVTYRYAVAAVDDSHLRSLSKPVSAARISMGQSNRPALKAAVDREHKRIVLRWQRGGNITKYWLYRAETGKPYRLYSTLAGNENAFTDESLFINTTYRYKLKSFDKQQNSAMSEEVQVQY